MRRGFTLIELLAVIVILAIISLIAIPIALDIVDDTREGAFKSTINNINSTIKIYTTSRENFEGETFEFPNVTGISFKGKMPKGTYIVDANGNTEFELSDGRFCAKKAFADITYEVTKGECETIVFEPIAYFEYQDISDSFNGYYEYTVGKTGKYKIQLWGASSYPTSGKGAYTEGEILLTKGTHLYFYIGGDHGYNGGGSARNGTGFGGGATDVRLEPGDWDSVIGLRSRIMVAAGGGSYGRTNNGGTHGGTLTSAASSSGNGSGGNSATQLAAGALRASFGKGGDGLSENGGHGGAGGGGYFGGGGVTPDTSADDDRGGSGGSSYISGHDGCIAIIGSDNALPKTNTWYALKNSVHYSKLYFINTVMKSGGEVMPTQDLETTMTGNTGNGYGIIQYIDDTKVVPDLAIYDNKVYDFDYDDYSNDYAEFEVPQNGYYTIELWGSSSYPTSGKGAYTKGDIFLEKGTKLYIYLGGNYGYNGGGSARNKTVFGGGATDVRIADGTWNNEVGLRSRIMVAAGGGSYGRVNGAGTHGGALTSAASSSGNGSGGNSATQLAGGSLRSSFGKGGDGISENGGNGGAGGGGYYGGGGVTPDTSADDDRGGSGGSSFISGHFGSIALMSSSSNAPKDIIANWIETSYHYSNHIFINTVMKSGGEEMPSYYGDSNITGNPTSGHARITIKSLQATSDDVEDYTYSYLYTGSVQTFTVPKDGNYKFQLYGAGSYPTSGKGAYTEGILNLTAGTKLYVYVGGYNGYNGGGSSRNGTVFGGGATDIRTANGAWDSEAGLRSRIMVAAGGGSYGRVGGAGTNGGALTSGSVSSGCGTGGTGATQIAAGSLRASFGKGGDGISANDGHGGAGGGGYYGGGGVNPDSSADDDKGGAGGSSYISGHSGCIAITSSESSTPKVTTFTTLSDSYHYSGYIFTQTNMINGGSAMPTLQGNNTKTGNTGNGYARITLVE